MGEMKERLSGLEPPIGFGPPLRQVMSVIRRRRPPFAVVVGCTLVAATAMVFLAIAIAFARQLLTDEIIVVPRILAVIVGPSVPLLTAAFGYRGIKRALAGGAYREAMFSRASSRRCASRWPSSFRIF
jgi:hypothetical protein